MMVKMNDDDDDDDDGFDDDDGDDGDSPGRQAILKEKVIVIFDFLKCLPLC